MKEISWTHCVENLGKGDPGVEHDYKRVVFVTPDDGFIMGARKTLYHLNGCPCPTCNVFRCRVRNGVDISGEPIKVVVISEKEFETLKAVGTVKDMAKVEQLRRRRIGTANTGKVPWNKGGKHSKETIEKIRATTLMHMANPAYRERLKASYNGSNARHSEYTRAKIKRASVERARARKLETAGLESKQVWGLKRGMNGAASAGIFVRRNSAVMTVTFGVNGTADIARLRQRQKDEEKVRLKTQRELKKQLVATLVLKRRAMRKVKPKVANKRTREHRAKISKAIADKWRDPEYSAKMRKKRKNSAASAASQQHPSVDPAKKKLLAEIKAMYLKADAAVKTLRARADNGLTVDPAMLAQATQTRKQTRTMLETVRKNIEQEFQARDAAAAVPFAMDADATFACLERALAECSVVLGMHPDQATEPIVDAAIELGKPFAVVPCCVFPELFPERRTKDGDSVRTYVQFLDYLVAKHPDIKLAYLPFKGRNRVVYRL